MIKHLLLAVAASATLFTANAAEPPVVLWEADNPEGVTLNWWNGDINIAPDACSGFTLGGKIEVTIDKQEGCIMRLCYKPKPEDDWTDLFQFALGSENPETASVTLQKPQLDIMKNHGFAPVGYNVTIHKIAYVPSDIEVDDNAIWVGPHSFAQDDFNFVEFPADLFSNAKAGDKLVCMISEAHDPFIELLIGGWEEDFFIKINNTYIHPERFTTTEDSITVTLTQEEVDKLKARGLVMPANRFVLNQLLLVTVPDNPTGTTNLVIDNNDCAVEYYNLQGVRVSNPENGIFIRRQGNKTIKVIK